MNTKKSTNRQKPDYELGDFGTMTEPGTFRIERLLPGPIERVWAYLTESEKRGKWFASGEMELREGGRAELRFLHSELSEEKAVPEKFKALEKGVTIVGRVTSCIPPQLFGYSWTGDFGDNSEVSFELKPKGKEVLLIVTHSKLANREIMKGASSGWHAHLGILHDVLNAKAPRPFWTTHAKLEKEYDKRLPA